MGFLTPWHDDAFWDYSLRSLAADLRRLRPTEYSHPRNSPATVAPATVAPATVAPATVAPATVEPSYKCRSSSSGVSLQVELPGVSREHVSVYVEGRTLFIKGKRYRREPGSCLISEKRREECKVGHTDRVVELKYYLTLKLSERVDNDSIKADCCGDGLLVVNVPYREKDVKRIELGA